MKRILVIDDEENLRDTISLLLRARGFDVVTAADGLAGVKAARAHKPDLVISDINMEPVDGFMTLSIIKQLPATGRIPFVMVTGDRELDTMRKGLVLGADDYLTKPFTPEALLETVNTQLKRRESDIEDAITLVTELKEQLAGVGQDDVGETLEEIRKSGERIAASEDGTDGIRALGAGIAERAVVLRRSILHAGILARIEIVAGNPDALSALRRTATSDLLDVVDGECRQLALGYERVSDLRLQLAHCRVAVGSAALSRITHELAGNALRHSPAGTPVVVKCRVADQSVQLSFENKIQRRAPRTVPGEPECTPKDPWPDFDGGQGLRFVRRLTQIHGGNFSVVPKDQGMVAMQVELPLAKTSTMDGGEEADERW
jgi:two-component system sensor histidine kinase/response regulator